jgi:hypothetical protein
MIYIQIVLIFQFKWRDRYILEIPRELSENRAYSDLIHTQIFYDLGFLGFLGHAKGHFFIRSGN